MQIILTSQEYDTLRTMYKTEKDKKKAERIHIILLFHQGYKPKEIADILYLDENTISTWKNKFLNRKNINDWLSTNYVSYFGKVSCKSIQHLRSYLSVFKVPNKKELLNYLDCIGIKYGLSGLQKLLKRIGFSYQTIHKLPGKCPIEKQQQWIKTFNETIEKVTEQEVILFADSTHPTHNTTYSKIWTQKGKPRYIESNTGRQRLNICAAYNVDNQDLIFLEDETINHLSIIKLLDKCLDKYPLKERITIYLDNAAYHKSKEIKAYLEKNTTINLSFLPPYSPNLNPIERLWKFANEKVINLKYYPVFDEFKEKTTNFYHNISQYKQELENRINYNFQIFDIVQT